MVVEGDKSCWRDQGRMTEELSWEIFWTDKDMVRLVGVVGSNVSGYNLNFNLNSGIWLLCIFLSWLNIFKKRLSCHVPPGGSQVVPSVNDS